MLSLPTLQVLFKQSSLGESFITHKCLIRLKVSNGQTYTSSEAEVKQRLAVWAPDALPPIKVPPSNNAVGLEFLFQKNGVAVGAVKCSLTPGLNRKDCLDVADEKYRITGKFLFSVRWDMGYQQPVAYGNPYQQIHQTQASQQYQPYPEQNFYNQQGSKSYQLAKPGSKPLAPRLSSSQTQYPSLEDKRVSNYKPPNLQAPYFNYNQGSQKVNKTLPDKKEKKPEKGGFLGMLGCFGCVPSISKKAKPYFLSEVLLLDENSLPYAEVATGEVFPVQYYSSKPA